MNHKENRTGEPDRQTLGQPQPALDHQSPNRQPHEVDQQPDTTPLESQPTRDPVRRRAIRRLFRAEIIYAAALAVFALLALFAHLYAYFAWDLATARALQNLQ